MIFGFFSIEEGLFAESFSFSCYTYLIGSKMKWGPDMRHTARDTRSETLPVEETSENTGTVSTVENPLVEELHTVAPMSAPSWKTPSVVVSEEKKKDPFKRNTMFVSIDEELSDTADRPLAPSTATILSEKQVKERFSYTDDQLVYRPDMKLGEKIIVTFRKVAVWFSDVWDKYVLFMKNHFPTVFEGHDVSRITTIGICALFVLIGLIVIGSLLLR